MKFGRFDKDVLVLTPSGECYPIRSATQAIDYLATNSDICRDAALVARNLCRAVLNDLLHPKVARRAFERALRGASLLVEDQASPASTSPSGLSSSQRLRYVVEAREPM